MFGANASITRFEPGSTESVADCETVRDLPPSCVSVPLTVALKRYGQTATAVGFLVAAGNSTEEADGLLLALRAKEGKQAVCPSSRYAAACSEIESRRQDHDTFRNVGVTALVVGGAALATAIGWFVFAPDQPAKTGSQAIAPRASLTPWGGPAAGGASVVGRF